MLKTQVVVPGCSDSKHPSIVLCPEVLGSGSGTSDLGLGDSLAVHGGCHSSISGWSSCISSEVVV
jgi:hypothetical protein